MRFPRKFRPVCQYVIRDKKPQDIKILDQTLWQKSGVVYARTYRNKVVYIGSTDGRLSRRMGTHLNRPAPKYRDWAEQCRSVAAHRAHQIGSEGCHIGVEFGQANCVLLLAVHRCNRVSGLCYGRSDVLQVVRQMR
jgi:hypothetical protein